MGETMLCTDAGMPKDTHKEPAKGAPNELNDRINFSETTDRINAALDTLKNELMEIRIQDVRLLKQLLHINDTIRKMTRDKYYRRLAWSSMRQSSAPLKAGSPTSPRMSLHATLIRQASEPQYCRTLDRQTSRSSVDSNEDAMDSTDDLYLTSGSELEDSTSSIRSLPSYIHLRSSHSNNSVEHIVSKEEDTFYSELLKKNVQLWKCQVSVDEVDMTLGEEESHEKLLPEGAR